MLHITLLSLIIVGIASASVSAQSLPTKFSSAAFTGCLDVKSNEEMTLQLSDCDIALRWIVNLPMSVPSPIRLASSPNFCLDGINVNTTNTIQLRECARVLTQLWFIGEGGDGHSTIGLPVGGRCINTLITNDGIQIVSSLACFEQRSGWDILLQPPLTSQNLD